MAECIVNVFEIIKVHEEQCHFLPVSPSPGKNGVHVRLHIVTIEQTCKLIEISLVDQLFLPFGAFGNVLHICDNNWWNIQGG